MDFFRSALNRLGFCARNLLSWSLPYTEQVEDPGELDLAARELLSRYDLAGLQQRGSRERFLETLTYLRWLEVFYQCEPQAFDGLSETVGSTPLGEGSPTVSFQEKPTLRWLDAGAKNWSYVEAIPAFLKARLINSYELDGVEIDTNRRYANFRTRASAANYFIRELPEARYHAGDLLRWNQPAHVISHFLPFVFEDPHLAWGLPGECFQPQAVLDHLLGLLEPGGLMLIVNQGEVESEAQGHLLESSASRLPISFQSLGTLPEGFIGYRYPRYGWLCRKASA